MAGSTTTTGALMVAICVFLALTVLNAEETQAQAKSLLYRFTIRSFLPAGCHRTYASLNATWSYAHLGGTSVYPTGTGSKNTYVGSQTGTIGTSTGAEMCPVWNDIASGKFNGHPDFETSGDVYAEGCSGTSFNLTSSVYGGTNCGGPVLTPIVDRTLIEHEDGLPKPIYCTQKRFSNDSRCGWLATFDNAGSIRATTSGPQYFNTWYRDSSEYNMRTGVVLRLTETAVGSNNFRFSSSSFYPLATNFAGTVGPVKPKPCNTFPNRTIDCSNGGRYFPLADKIFTDDSATRVFSFSSEHHSFFQFKGTEKFRFSGDDDVWVYINERLAVDVGGLHPARNAEINLANPFVQSQLGLVVGGVYALDMYHAERHTDASNFEITTGLAGGCNVLQSGKIAYTWAPATLNTDWKLIGGPTWGRVQSGAIRLTDSVVPGSVGYAFLKQQVNVGTGFVITFNFTASAKGEGFVFIIQRDDIVDLNGGTGGNLGFRNTLNSVGIVFDMCVDRDTNIANPPCNQRELRMHYRPNGGPNSAASATKVLRAPLLFPVVPNDGQTHTVVINYFGQSPPWLEVLVDDDLILQKRGINLDQVIGGRNAFVGFSAANGVTTSSVSISNFVVSAVAIEDRLTTVSGLPNVSDPPLNATADGRKFVAVDLKNFDFCGNTIEFGGFGSRAKGVLTLVELASEDDSNARRLLQGSNSTGNNSTTNSTAYIGMTVDAEIVDNQNGNYSLRFRTTVPGTYSMQVWYGAGCFSNGSNTGNVLPNPPASTCFTAYRNRTAVFSPVPPTPPPPPVEEAAGLGQEAITGIGVAVGIISAVGGMLIVVGLRIRRQWRRDKEFIDAGRAAVAERGVEYLGDSDLDALQNRLQQTLHAIQAERAKKLREGDKQAMIDELNRQRGELQEQVRRLKIKLNGGDPNMIEPEGLGIRGRIRKSFAAGRVSRGFSARMSRGISLALGAPNIPEGEPIGSEMSSSNPLFSRFSQAFGARKKTVPDNIDV